jgi:hypothetical protein
MGKTLRGDFLIRMDSLKEKEAKTTAYTEQQMVTPSFPFSSFVIKFRRYIMIIHLSSHGSRCHVDFPVLRRT